LILSLAAFYTGDGRERNSTRDYLSRIEDLLEVNGYFVFESTLVRKHEIRKRESVINNMIQEICRKMKIVKQERVEYPKHFRYILIAQKKEK